MTVVVTPRIIAVVGGSSRVPDDVLRDAGKLGAEIALHAILLTGGDGRNPETVKDAAVLGARGASSSARIISILKDAGGLSPGSSTIRSGMDHGRNVLNAVAGDAMVALEGGAGTLSEVAFAQMTGRRVIFFGGAETKLAKALQNADFSTIASQAAAQQGVLPVPCTAANVEKYARQALANGFKTRDVQQAVQHAMAAALLAALPPVNGVDPSEYARLLTRFGR